MRKPTARGVSHLGTSGKNDAKTCHPFPISSNFGDLRKTEGEEDAVLFHNGILAEGGIVSPLSSDTQDFVVAMSPLLKRYNQSKSRDFFIEEMIKGNRLLVLYKNNAFKMFGEWKKDGDLWVSNLHYKSPYNWYGGQYYGAGGWVYEDDLDELYYSEKAKQKSEKVQVHNLAPLSTHEAIALWEEIIGKTYKYISKDELNMLKQSAEYRTGEMEGTMERAGFVLGYDVSDYIIVWLEDTPETKTETETITETTDDTTNKGEE